jgi:hypothetical protein
MAQAPQRNRIGRGRVWRDMNCLIASLTAVGLLAAACGSPAPSPAPTGTPTAPPADFEIEAAQFVTTGGCGDAFLWATNAAGTAAITIEWSGAASEAWAEDEFTDTQELPNPEITVSVVEGSQLSSYYCNDIRMPGQGPTSTIEAVTGTVELTVRPSREGFEPAGQADLRLSDVTFEVGLGAGETWHLDELVIENVSVGWLAG